MPASASGSSSFFVLFLVLVLARDSLPSLYLLRFSNLTAVLAGWVDRYHDLPDAIFGKTALALNVTFR
jgi:hypothetical protein